MNDLNTSKYLPRNGESNMHAEIRSENEAIEYNRLRDACIDAGMTRSYIAEFGRICGHDSAELVRMFQEWQRFHCVNGNIKEGSVNTLVEWFPDAANC